VIRRSVNSDSQMREQYRGCVNSTAKCVNSNRMCVNSNRRCESGQNVKDQKLVILPFSFLDFWISNLGDSGGFFTSLVGVSILYPKVFIFHESMIIFII